MTHLLAEANVPAISPGEIVDIDDFGAKANGTELIIVQAFLKAWKEACSSNNEALFVIPKNKTYHFKPVKFSGPCKSAGLTMKIYGKIKATVNQSDYRRIQDTGLCSVVLKTSQWKVVAPISMAMAMAKAKYGGQTHAKCDYFHDTALHGDENCLILLQIRVVIFLLKAVTFIECNNLTVAGLRFKDSPKIPLSFQKCVDVKVLNLQVIAPRDSPNTDGIRITKTQNMQIIIYHWV
ncbi:hypothetical protein Pint_23993 [Pistacia integerrima]|uniref:Uncharacterized protein n=1 Tax=Pistacia integerrima TaxID=434235 RepID=A0ACC0YL74_9ROSI|nr:hypothetical protein Pint_23993 [Pistacia integerrima]